MNRDRANNVAIAFMIRDKVNLSRQVVPPLLQPDAFDLHIFDGSETEEGKQFPAEVMLSQPPNHATMAHGGVRGGPDAAVAYALTTLLAGTDYEYIGLVENDVVLPADWFESTMGLFVRGSQEGLDVGAVSTRAYEDRIFVQRDGYALMHNLGWGQQIMSRRAAQLALSHMRTSWTTENRRVFSQLSGIDIGTWWAFRMGEHPIGSDWGNDRMLAAHGLASLALTPSPVEMIGQDPPLEQQGLTIARQPVEQLRNDGAFDLFVKRTAEIRNGTWKLPAERLYFPGSLAEGGLTIFPHHLRLFGAIWAGDWRLRFCMGWGPFVWKAGEEQMWMRPGDRPTGGIFPTLTLPAAGPMDFLVSGGDHGGEILVEDLQSGYSARPKLPSEHATNGQILVIPVPSSAVAYRDVRLTALTPGVCVFGARFREPQPYLPACGGFDWTHLPRV